MKPANFSTLKLVQKMSLNQFNRWVMSVYQSGFADGLKEGEKELDDCIAEMTDDRLMEILLSINGVGEKRAKQIYDAILAEGVFIHDL